MRYCFLLILAGLCGCATDQRITKMDSGLENFGDQIQAFIKNKNVSQISDKLGFPIEEKSISGNKLVIWGKEFNVPMTEVSAQEYKYQNTRVSGTTTSTKFEQLRCKLIIEFDKFEKAKKYEFDGSKGGCYRYGAYLGFIANEID